MPKLQTRRSLLLVDDDVQLRILLTMLLDRSGYAVQVAGDGFAALRAMREQPFETILSDLCMPGMSGFELLSVVRRRYPMVRAIAMSASYSGRANPEGVVADAFHSKLDGIDDLLALLEETPQGEHLCRAQYEPDAIPIWIPQSARDQSASAPVTLACPECLRTFQQACDQWTSAIQQACCTNCGAGVRFAIVQPDSMPFHASAHSLQAHSLQRESPLAVSSPG